MPPRNLGAPPGGSSSRRLFCSSTPFNNSALALRREWPLVEKRATVAMASAQEQGLAMGVAVGRNMQGAVPAMMDPCSLGRTP
jgi:hypothetical protein